MTVINKNTSLLELAFIIGKTMKDNGINAVLVGGSVVSFYTENKYMSYDLDYISSHNATEISHVLSQIGFKKEGRYYKHENTDFFIEFPAGPVSVGDTILDDFNEIETQDGYVKLLKPVHAVMDRLAAFYYWSDWQSLKQAIMIIKNVDVDISEIKKWSQSEGQIEKYNIFIQLLEKE